MLPKECKRLAEVDAMIQPMQIREERALYGSGTSRQNSQIQGGA